jgi:hypothetical protein
MLFILVMDVLGHMISKAAELGLLQPLSRRALQHRISMNADDVVLFLHPNAADIVVTMDILQLFGTASGLYKKVTYFLSDVVNKRLRLCSSNSLVHYQIFHANIWVYPSLCED